MNTLSTNIKKRSKEEFVSIKKRIFHLIHSNMFEIDKPPLNNKYSSRFSVYVSTELATPSTFLLQKEELKKLFPEYDVWVWANNLVHLCNKGTVHAGYVC